MASRTTEADELAPLAEAFAAIADRLAPGNARKQARAMALRLVETAEKKKNCEELGRLSRAFTALAVHLPQKEAGSVAGVLASRFTATIHQAQGNHESKSLESIWLLQELPQLFETLCGLLSVQQLVDLLKQPGSDEDGRKIILQLLGRRRKAAFSTVWDLVDHIHRHQLDLDCAAPLQRHGGSLEARLRKSLKRNSDEPEQIRGEGDPLLFEELPEERW